MHPTLFFFVFLSAARTLLASTEVRVLQLYRNPGVDEPKEALDLTASETELLKYYDEVTVKVKSDKHINSIVLMLPEKQQCRDGDCAGFSFPSPTDSPRNCWHVARGGRQKESTDLDLFDKSVPNPHGHELMCVVDNEGKRSKLTLTLLARHQADAGRSDDLDAWAIFTVYVRNPVSSPQGKDKQFDDANTFEVVVKEAPDEGGGEEIFRVKAAGIARPMVCSYSQWKQSSVCSARCGGGVRMWYRHVLKPPSSHTSKPVHCDEALVWYEDCNLHTCDLDCQLGDWVRWADGPCSASCGGGWEVQRRPVQQSALGQGKLCPAHNHDDRVRYVACNTDPCLEKRCRVAKARLPDSEADPAIIATPCSAPIQGHRSVLGLAVEKDPGEAGESGECVEAVREDCSLAEPSTVSFFPSRPGRVAEEGEWYDVTLLFSVQSFAERLRIEAPEGFILHKRGDSSRCLLVEHNFPRLKRCFRVSAGKTQKHDAMSFEFFNPLEVHGRSGQRIQYQLRFWVLHPMCPESGKTSATQTCTVDSKWMLGVFSHMSTERPDFNEEIYASYALNTKAEADRQRREYDDAVHTQKMYLLGHSRRVPEGGTGEGEGAASLSQKSELNSKDEGSEVEPEGPGPRSDEAGEGESSESLLPPVLLQVEQREHLAIVGEHRFKHPVDEEGGETKRAFAFIKGSRHSTRGREY